MIEKSKPLASLALAVTIGVAKEVLAVHAGDFFPGHYVPQHLNAGQVTKFKKNGSEWARKNLNAGPVSSSWHKLAVWSAVMVDVGGSAEPQLRAVFPDH